MKTQTDYEFVLIVSLGRTGSTLLQGLLNSLVGVTLRGENQNACLKLFEAYRGLLARQNQHANLSRPVLPTSAWYGIDKVQLDRLIESWRLGFVNYILRPPKHCIMIGFKEIRYDIGNVTDLTDYLLFLQLLFPNVRVIVNTRNPNDVAKSKWWATLDGDVPALIDESQKRIRAAAAEVCTRHIVVEYEQISASVESMIPVCEFLERPYDPKALQVTLDTPHSY